MELLLPNPGALYKNSETILNLFNLKNKTTTVQEDEPAIAAGGSSSAADSRPKKPRLDRNRSEVHHDPDSRGIFDTGQAQSSSAPMVSSDDKGGWREGIIHFTGGAIGGTAGTALTCPFEVVKTRMQSTNGFDEIKRLRNVQLASTMAGPSSSCGTTISNPVLIRIRRIAQWPSNYRRTHWPPLTMLAIRQIWKDGGFPSLFKGLTPNLIGVTPARAIYFCTYSATKRYCNTYENIRDTAFVYLVSAVCGGFVAATMVNPVSVVKTRLQLHQGRMGAWECMKRIWQIEGLRGFYRGVTGSYCGILETVIQFVIYEYLREVIIDPERKFVGFSAADKQQTAFIQFMFAGGIARACAVILGYPHEIFRTRLREEGNKYNLRQIGWNIYREHGLGVFYRGLGVQLIRSVPNMAITMFTYELVVYMLYKYWVHRPAITMEMGMPMALMDEHE